MIHTSYLWNLVEIQFWKFGLIWHNLDSTFLHIERRIHILIIHTDILVDYITIICTNSKFLEFSFWVEASSGFLWIWAASCAVVHTQGIFSSNIGIVKVKQRNIGANSDPLFFGSKSHECSCSAVEKELKLRRSHICSSSEFNWATGTWKNNVFFFNQMFLGGNVFKIMVQLQ